MFELLTSARTFSQTPVFDRARSSRESRNRFRRARNAETSYRTSLEYIAQQVDRIVRAFVGPDGEVSQEGTDLIQEHLTRYSRVIEGWARTTAERMVTEVDARDHRAWMQNAREMGIAVRQELTNAPTGLAMRAAMARQVSLITSLPTEAAERVHRLVVEGLSTGMRAGQIAERIMETGEVTTSRARLIARTEVGRAATEFSRARADAAGSTHFIWRTAGDRDVRESHAKLSGKVFRWDDPPECDPGHRALPGAIWNCRCWPEPVFVSD